MQTYIALLDALLTRGERRTDRTGTGTLSIFGECQVVHDLATGFPLLTTKRVSIRNIITELMWFLRGDTNIAFLHSHGCHIWDEWADTAGNLGPVYGAQWRDYRGIQRPKDTQGDWGDKKVRIDQIEKLVNGLIEKWDSRRHIVSAWDPANVDHMALPPCHTLFQCCVSSPIEGEKQKLSLKLYARSIDCFLGLPYNITSYALLLTMLANTCGYEPGKLFITFGDLHLYANHVEQAREQLSREPRPLPRLWLNGAHKGMPLDEYNHDHFALEDYNPHPAIKAPIAV